MQGVGFGVWLKHNALFSNYYFKEKRVDIWNSLPPEVVKMEEVNYPTNENFIMDYHPCLVSSDLSQ